MKVIVTHASPDWDAITSVWLLRRFLPNWNNAKVQFVPAGDRISPLKENQTDPIEHVGNDEVIHVDTGLGPLDHHQIASDKVCGASRTWDYVKEKHQEFLSPNERATIKMEAIDRIVGYVVELDHFKEVFWEDASADRHEFGLYGLLEGVKLQKPNEDEFYILFGSECLDAEVHNFENRIWAEHEIQEKGIVFETACGKALGIETVNDATIKLAQKMGYNIVIRKDPRKGYVRIKTLPVRDGEKKKIDLTLTKEKLAKMDPDATWFLHVSKRMLLNGTPKNPKMVPTKLSLEQIISVVKEVA
ncbi:MAG: hypothetical protein ACREGI_03665 [Candidatus Levyibacteriota bacterium]